MGALWRFDDPEASWQELVNELAAMPYGGTIEVGGSSAGRRPLSPTGGLRQEYLRCVYDCFGTLGWNRSRGLDDVLECDSGRLWLCFFDRGVGGVGGMHYQVYLVRRAKSDA